MRAGVDLAERVIERRRTEQLVGLVATTVGVLVHQHHPKVAKVDGGVFGLGVDEHLKGRKGEVLSRVDGNAGN